MQSFTFITGYSTFRDVIVIDNLRNNQYCRPRGFHQGKKKSRGKKIAYLAELSAKRSRVFHSTFSDCACHGDPNLKIPFKIPTNFRRPWQVQNFNSEELWQS